MVYLLLFVAVIVLLAVLLGGSTSTAPTTQAKVIHTQDDESHITYWKDGQLIHESDACSGCMENRCAELERKRYEVVEVRLGRRHSGQL